MFRLNHENKFHIGVAGETEADLRIGAGISSFDPTSNEETDDSSYLDGGGVTTTDVIGGQPAIAFEGHRNYGDPAQDMIFGLQNQYNESRVVNFSWEQPDGTTLKGAATLMNIEGPGGESNAKGEVSFEIRFRGAPTITPAPAPAG